MKKRKVFLGGIFLRSRNRLLGRNLFRVLVFPSLYIHSDKEEGAR